MALSAFIVYVSLFSLPAVHTITIGAEEVEPSVLTVHIGDTVRIRSTAGRFFLPRVTDSSPSTGERGGDARAFERMMSPAGTWLWYPSVQGVYAITFSNERAVVSVDVRQKELRHRKYVQPSFCNEDSAIAYTCWHHTLVKTFEKHGLRGAWAYIRTQRVAQGNFSAACARYIEELGYHMYHRFGLAVPLAAELGYCGSVWPGFWHGYAERMGTVQKVPGVCRRAQWRLHAVDARTLQNCMYGAVSAFAQKYVQDNPTTSESELLRWKDALCTALGISPDDHACLRPVYDVLVQKKLRDEPVREEEIFKSCSGGVRARSSEPCITAFAARANIFLSSHTLQKQLWQLATLPDARMQRSAVETYMSTITHNMVRIKKEDPIAACLSLNSELQSACVRGMATGMMHGELVSLFSEAALSLCTDARLSSSLRAECLRALASVAEAHGGAGDARVLCERIERAGYEAEVQVRCVTVPHTAVAAWWRASMTKVLVEGILSPCATFSSSLATTTQCR